MLIRFSTLLLFVFALSAAFAQKIILQGTVKQSDGSPLKSSAVMLIQFNPATKMFSVLDSAYTDANGHYKFDGSMQYYILARPDEMADGELPTYYGNAIFSQKATPVQINYGEPVTADFSTTKKAMINEGPGSIGGSVGFKDKTVRGAVPHTAVFLGDKDRNPVAVTATDAAGNFRFRNLALGNYYVMVDFAGIDNATADEIALSVQNPQKTGLHFWLEDGTVVCEENNYTSIKEAMANRENVYMLNLNSLQHDVAEKSLVISPDGSRMLMLQIGDLANLEWLSLDINMINFLPAEIGKLGKLTYLSANLNKLASLPSEMAGLKNLQTLHLGKNNFSQFPEVITGYAKLEVLNFENNPITALPVSISALKNLKVLNLDNCYDLLALPPQIGELQNLTELNLSNCIKLKALPKELNNLKNLKVLDITGTKLNAKAFQKAVPGCEVRMTKK